jgi:LysR family transcriptional activator of nhaA
VPSLLEEQFRREYGRVRVGEADGVIGEFFAISVERRIRNPAVAAMTGKAHMPRKGD